MIRAAYTFVKFLKDNRGIEGLPLKYVIIVLVAAIVIVIAVTMTNMLGGAVESGVGNITGAMEGQVNSTLGALP